jgi:hypothetical protein
MIYYTVYQCAVLTFFMFVSVNEQLHFLINNTNITDIIKGIGWAG